MEQIAFTHPDQVPENFWRVSAKAIVFDADDRLLVFRDESGAWEIPGGGWDHNESYEECLRRELSEEVGVGITYIYSDIFCYRGTTIKGFPKICIAARVTMDDKPLRPGSDDLVVARYVTKKEFLDLPFHPGEEPIKQYIGLLWPDQ